MMRSNASMKQRLIHFATVCSRDGVEIRCDDLNPANVKWSEDLQRVTCLRCLRSIQRAHKSDGKETQ